MLLTASRYLLTCSRREGEGPTPKCYCNRWFDLLNTSNIATVKWRCRYSITSRLRPLTILFRNVFWYFIHLEIWNFKLVIVVGFNTFQANVSFHKITSLLEIIIRHEDVNSDATCVQLINLIICHPHVHYTNRTTITVLPNLFKSHFNPRHNKNGKCP